MIDVGFYGSATSEIGDHFWRLAASGAADQHEGLEVTMASLTTVGHGDVRAIKRKPRVPTMKPSSRVVAILNLQPNS